MLKEMIENPDGEAGSLFNKFKIIPLTEQMRASDDKEQSLIISTLINPIEYMFPVRDSGVLDRVQDLSSELLQSDPEWRNNVTLLTNRNVVRVAVNLGMAKHYAQINNQTIIAWIQRPFAQTLQRCDIQARAENVSIETVLRRQDQLQFLFVPGAPACITNNVSVCLGIANGAVATLHSLSLSDDVDADDQIWDEINATPPGDTYWLEKPPARVNIRMKAKNPEIWKQGLNCISIEHVDGSTYVVVPMKTSERSTPLKTGKRGRKNKSGKVDPADDRQNGFNGHGIDLGFAMTYHKAQGATLPRVIVDIGNSITLPELYVGISRVRKLTHIAKCHITLEQRMKLNELQHNHCIVKYYERQHPEKLAAKREQLKQQIEEKRQIAVAKLAASGKKSSNKSCSVATPKPVDQRCGGKGLKGTKAIPVQSRQVAHDKRPDTTSKSQPTTPAPKRRKVSKPQPQSAIGDTPTWIDEPKETDASKKKISDQRSTQFSSTCAGLTYEKYQKIMQQQAAQPMIVSSTLSTKYMPYVPNITATTNSSLPVSTLPKPPTATHEPMKSALSTMSKEELRELAAANRLRRRRRIIEDDDEYDE